MNLLWWSLAVGHGIAWKCSRAQPATDGFCLNRRNFIYFQFKTYFQCHGHKQRHLGLYHIIYIKFSYDQQTLFLTATERVFFSAAIDFNKFTCSSCKKTKKKLLTTHTFMRCRHAHKESRLQRPRNWIENMPSQRPVGLFATALITRSQ